MNAMATRTTILAALLSLAAVACDSEADAVDFASDPSTATGAAATFDPADRDASDDEGGEGGGEGGASETGEAESEGTAACCYCLPGGTWECLPWTDDAQSCIDWGYAEQLTVSWFLYCAEAYTETTDDDVMCPATCA